MQTQLAGRGVCSSSSTVHHHQQHRHRAAAAFCSRSRALVTRVCASSANGNGRVHAGCPTPAETARTVADLAQEGVLCTLTEASTPLGTPVGYSLDKEGNPLILVASGSPEASNIGRSSRCSLLVQPIAYPARGVASVALQGSAAAEGCDQSAAPEGTTLYKLEVDSCVYYGGLDQAAHGQVIEGETYRAAEPDLLRHAADELITTWNSDRAEDIYRIVSSHMNLPLEEMMYAELLWIDRLGIYVRTEALGRAPGVVRVPFYRPVLDERDARSVLTMGSHITWDAEKQRSGMAYVPQPIPTATPAGSNN